MEIGNHPITVTGLWRTGKLRDEFFDFVQNPEGFIAEMNRRKVCNLFTFIQAIPDRVPRFEYYYENEAVAVLPISTYEHWWTKQIDHKTRNMVRKGPKLGLDVRRVAFTDEFVNGIERILSETPIRQGRRFKHFGKTHEQIRIEHSSFLSRSEFMGAYFQGELVGYAKMVRGEGVTSLMQILSMNKHRDKAVTNSLIANAVLICAEAGVPLLQYGTWSRRSMGTFKMNHAFERWEIPRYYVPITRLGRLLLNTGLHHSLKEKLPGYVVDYAASWRASLNSLVLNHP